MFFYKYCDKQVCFNLPTDQPTSRLSTGMKVLTFSLIFLFVVLVIILGYIGWKKKLKYNLTNKKPPNNLPSLTQLDGVEWSKIEGNVIIEGYESIKNGNPKTTKTHNIYIKNDNNSKNTQNEGHIYQEMRGNCKISNDEVKTIKLASNKHKNKRIKNTNNGSVKRFVGVFKNTTIKNDGEKEAKEELYLDMNKGTSTLRT